MKKVLQQAAKWIFGLFAIAVFGLMISLTYQALQRIFPTRFDNQIWGLVLFDIAAVVWAVAYIFHSKSTAQYAASGIGFLTGLLGTLGMIAAEVTLGSNLVTADPQQIGQWLLWGFIGTTALHLILIYMHHFTAPELAEQINVGIARGEITTEAIRQATQGLEQEKAQLAESIARGIKEQVMRDLNLPIPADPRMPFLPADPTQYEQTIPYPTQQNQTAEEKYAAMTPEQRKARAKELGMWFPNDPNDTPFERSNPKLHKAIVHERTKPKGWKNYVLKARDILNGKDTAAETEPQDEPKASFFRADPSYHPKSKDEADQPERPFRGSPSE